MRKSKEEISYNTIKVSVRTLPDSVERSNRDHRRQIITNCHLFKGIDDSTTDYLLEYSISKVYEEAETIFDPQVEDDSVYIIISGSAAIGVGAPDSSKHLEFEWAGPGEVFGELEVFAEDGPGPRETDAVAMTTLSAVAIKGKTVREVVGAFAPALTTLIASRQRRMVAALKEAAFVGLVEIRLARSLLEQARRFGHSHCAALSLPAHKLTQGRIADMVGADKRSVLETLGAWSDSGIVHHHQGRLTILDPRRLAAIAARQPGQRSTFEPRPLLCEIDAALASGQNVYARDLALTALKRKSLRNHPTLQHRLILATARCGGITEALHRLRDQGLDHRHADNDIASLEPRLMKDLALAATDPATRRHHAAASARQYEIIAQRGDNYYPAINAAAMFLLAGERDRAATWAQAVLRRLPVPNAYFEHASRAEARLILGDRLAAGDAYQSAIRTPDANPGAVATSRRQIRMIGQALGLDVAGVLAQATQGDVIHFTGHLADPNSPTKNVEATAEGIERSLIGLNLRWAYGSLACGSDVLFAEAALQRAAELTIVLPCDVDGFIERSVRRGGRSWVARFRHCLSEAHRVIVLPWTVAPSPLAYAWADRIAMGLALRRAQELEAPVSQFAVWNEQKAAKGAGTALAVSEWLRLGQASTPIACQWRSESVTAPPVAATAIPAALLWAGPSGSLIDTDDGEQLSAAPAALCATTLASGRQIWLFETVAAAAAAAAALRRHHKWDGATHRMVLDLVFAALDEPRDETLRRSWLAMNQPATPPGTIAATEIFIAESLIATGEHWPGNYIGYMQCQGSTPPTPMYLLESVESVGT